MKIKNSIFILGMALILLNSCVSNKKFVLMQNAKTSALGDTSRSNYLIDRTNVYKLQINDILYISLSSPDEAVSQLFAHSINGMQMMQQQSGIGSILYLTGYSISKEGEISLPVIGKIKVVGLSVSEAKEMVENELNKYFKVFHLVMQLSEVSFTILGEVQRPGRFSGQTNQITILEAIASAGDFTPIANRKSVMLVRQTTDGLKVFNVDFTDANLLTTPYFVLRPNDVIYVLPLKSRTIGNLTSFQNSLTTITPLLTTLVLALNTYIILTK
jgi:polysaccharide export outer membrane protein